MHRLSDYCRIALWQSGLGYLALWAFTWWTLDAGAAFFGRSGLCHPDEAKVLFYWVCEPGTARAAVAALANAALTVTVWAPVYLAAAFAQPEALLLAIPIALTHLIGLPAAIFVVMRAATALLARLRRRSGTADAPYAGAIVTKRVIIVPRRIVKPRQEFGLRKPLR